MVPVSAEGLFRTPWPWWTCWWGLFENLRSQRMWRKGEFSRQVNAGWCLFPKNFGTTQVTGALPPHRHLKTLAPETLRSATSEVWKGHIQLLHSNHGWQSCDLLPFPRRLQPTFAPVLVGWRISGQSVTFLPFTFIWSYAHMRLFMALPIYTLSFMWLFLLWIKWLIIFFALNSFLSSAVFFVGDAWLIFIYFCHCSYHLFWDWISRIPSRSWSP